ncbi:hypothetical protein [Bifidobacterium platyrrhinorum]|uniref:Uncharacterized protein n=1 Tax=Bifidobacterium platyrrhinorum TaxID=2661628 RepID=A0A6L9SSE7_9BIFI|nr:hypothetical protein [Bifidobacterium platyrrhinorum]NEG55444.1 hypothetical protein [Bifidobacterium platyrrhinorum]
MEKSFDEQLAMLDGMLRERRIGTIEKTGDGCVLWILDDWIVDGEPTGREFSFQVDSLEQVRDECNRLHEYGFNAEDDVKAMLADGESIDSAYLRMVSVRMGLSRAYMLAAEIIEPPMTTYVATRDCIVTEQATFEAPAGMDCEEAEDWFNRHCDDLDMNWEPVAGEPDYSNMYVSEEE